MKIAIWKKTVQQKTWASLLLPAALLLPASLALADDHPHDHGDNPVLTRVIIDQLELRDADGANPVALEAQAWIGKDLNKLWLKTDVERRDGETEEAEVQALYSRALAPFWDIQMGVRYDAKPTPTRTWGVIGVQGLAPYWFEIDTALFVEKSGRTAARFSAEYELLFTQKLILTPSVEVNVYGQNDAETGTGSGLSDAKAGLRLRYEIRREFAPYIGVNWNKTFGKTADFVKTKGEAVSDTELVIGLRAWF
ncbi:MAG TPA: copper resistance protein B [Cellvibrio sp.]|nr:copper resistance protein B [Cellvibrio sp.]